MINLVERLRADLRDAPHLMGYDRQDIAEAAAEIERLTAENARFRGCLEFIAKPVVDRGGIVDSSEALIRAAAARDVLNLKATP